MADFALGAGGLLQGFNSVYWPSVQRKEMLEERRQDRLSDQAYRDMLFNFQKQQAEQARADQEAQRMRGEERSRQLTSGYLDMLTPERVDSLERSILSQGGPAATSPRYSPNMPPEIAKFMVENRIAKPPTSTDALLAQAIASGDESAIQQIIQQKAAIAGAQAKAEAPFKAYAVAPGGTLVQPFQGRGNSGFRQLSLQSGIPLNELAVAYAPGQNPGDFSIDPNKLSPQAQQRFSEMMQQQPGGGGVMYQDPRPAPGTMEGAGSKLLGEESAKAYIKSRESYQSVANKFRTTQQINALLGDIETGAGGDLKLSVSKLVNFLGGEESLRKLGIDPATIGPREAAQVAGRTLALQLRNPAEGAGLPGQMSDADRNYLASMAPSLLMTKQGRTILESINKAELERVSKAKGFYEKEIKAKGTPSVAAMIEADALNGDLLDGSFKQMISQVAAMSGMPTSVMPGTGAGRIRYDMQGNRVP